MKLFTIYDSKADSHIAPLAHQNAETAIRQLRQQLKGTMYETNPEDFTLFEVGAFDDVTGAITPYQALRSVCNLANLFNADTAEPGVATIPSAATA